MQQEKHSWWLQWILHCLNHLSSLKVKTLQLQRQHKQDRPRHHIVPYSLYTSSIWQRNYLQTDRPPVGRPAGYLSPKPPLECSGNWLSISQFRPSAKCSQDTLNPHFHMPHVKMRCRLSVGCIQPSTHCFLVPSMFMITQIHGYSVCYGETVISSQVQ